NLRAISAEEEVNSVSHSEQLVNTITTTPFYRYVGKPCLGNKKRQAFRYLLKYWERFARRHAIQYVISFGSLLGQYRNKDAIPWDGDVDVMVN
ncbi:LicD family protein, partial [Salmonella sp. s51933]|uniref:LicD family protein n=1 Tax=Salmonella sp. s51933 TaxID=3160127 RepID=UPI003753FEC6